jgi:hypothetical protein
MKTPFKWLLVFALLAAVGGGLIWSYRNHHEATEEHEEKEVKWPKWEIISRR